MRPYGATPIAGMMNDVKYYYWGDPTGPEKNDVKNIRFSGLDGVRLIGCNAKIDVKGDFHRSADKKVAAKINLEPPKTKSHRSAGFENETTVFSAICRCLR